MKYKPLLHIDTTASLSKQIINVKSGAQRRHRPAGGDVVCGLTLPVHAVVAVRAGGHPGIETLSMIQTCFF